MKIFRPDFDDAEKIIEKNTILTMLIEGGAVDRLNTSGLLIQPDGEIAQVEEPSLGMPLFQELSGLEFYADRSVRLDAAFIEIKNRPAQELFYVPALLLLGVVVWRQRQRYRVTKRQES